MNPSIPYKETTLPLPCELINKSVYEYDIKTNTPIYDEDHKLLGYRGSYSYRPNGNRDNNGAIELITPENIHTRFDAMVKYKWNDGLVVHRKRFVE